jgi:concanavalin A-like lectin/glucanase superfamily protein
MLGILACNACAVLALMFGHPSDASVRVRQAQTYDQTILAARPVMYLEMNTPGSGVQVDASGHGHDGIYQPPGNHPRTAALPNGDLAADFDGLTQYVEVASSPALSVPRTGRLTIEAWIRPDTLQFPREEGSGYVYFLGKGQPNEYEYADRMYSKRNTEHPPRPNRISDYAWNLSGGLGSGGYFQDPVTVGQWIYVAAVIDMKDVSSTFPAGYIAIFKDGMLRNAVGLDQFGVVPQAGNAPFRVGSRDLGSFFKGAIGKVAVYDYVLTGAQIANHFRLMQ